LLAVLGKKREFRFFIFLLITGGPLLLGLGGCAASTVPITSKQHIKYYSNSYHPSVQRADDIQYRSAYKYDMKGNKYKKHYKEQEKRKEKK